LQGKERGTVFGKDGGNLQAPHGTEMVAKRKKNWVYHRLQNLQTTLIRKRLNVKEKKRDEPSFARKV